MKKGGGLTEGRRRSVSYREKKMPELGKARSVLAGPVYVPGNSTTVFTLTTPFKSERAAAMLSKGRARVPSHEEPHDEVGCTNTGRNKKKR